jgi:hypothetical protein
MRLIAIVAATLGGCSLYFNDPNGGSTPSPDARVQSIDAPPYMPPYTCSQALPVSQKASCQGGTASVDTLFYYMGAGSHSNCGYENKATVQCASGCGAESALALSGTTDWEIASFGKDAALLCAETPEAQVGAACLPNFGSPCLPTRAHLNADGTVASQAYLHCDPASYRCAVASPPVVASYLQPCDTTTLATYGKTDANGRAGTCLLAWDSAMQRITSGQTRICLGDWDCPAGSLCDDQITALDTPPPPRLAICKPGPRGTLTPAMLSP